jgi:2'-5' RNA ligase
MRTFLALCCSVGTTRRIAEAMEQKAAQLADPAHGGWKLAWIPPANLHVTIKFFGDIPAESVDAIALRLRQRLVDLPPLQLRIGGAGVFPAASEGPPRILWIGVDGGTVLTALHQSIEGDMEDLGFPKETRAFRPHITVARVLESSGLEGAEHLAAWSFDPTVPEDQIKETVDELVVYESQLSRPTRAGVEYLARARVPFTKS